MYNNQQHASFDHLKGTSLALLRNVDPVLCLLGEGIHFPGTIGTRREDTIPSDSGSTPFRYMCHHKAIICFPINFYITAAALEQPSAASESRSHLHPLPLFLDANRQSVIHVSISLIHMPLLWMSNVPKVY